MRKRKIFKAFLFAGCISALTAFCMNTVACKKEEVDNRPTIEGVSFAGEEVKSGPQFLEGILTELLVNDSIKLDEYIEYVKDSSYTITLTDEKGNVTDLTKKTYFKFEKVGTYVLTYTVASGANAGTKSVTLKVSNPELVCEFNLLNQPYNYGDELVFAEYFGSMNIYKSLANCDVYMDSVEVDGEEIDLAGQESYVFSSRSDHTFKFHVEAPDGQRVDGREVISIKYVDQEYMQELTDMGITLSGELYVEEGAFTMVKGSYANGNNVILQRANGPHISPYVAYNGEYGIGSYVMLDFTGTNMPIFSFFRDEYSSSMFDGSKGVVFTGGFKNNSGSPSHLSLTKAGYMYGPNMLHKPDEAFNATYRDTAYFGNSVSTGTDEPHPISLQGLKEDTHYRIMIGFSKIEVSTVNHLFTKEPTECVVLTLSCALLDLDNMQLVTKFETKSYGVQALGFDGIIPTDIEDNEFFKGNIVLYGNYGSRTVLDKIYPIITDRSRSFDEVFADQLDYSEFKSGAKTSVLGSSVELNVSDYVDTSTSGYTFYFVGEDGVRHDVTGDTFILSKPGSYTFYYIDGENLCASLPFSLIYVSEETQEWIASDNIKLHGIVDINEDKSAVLKAGTLRFGGTYTGPNPGNVVDQAYLAFDGNYGYNDFIAFDFTGKNMPEVAFFAQNYNNSMYYQDGGKQGMVFVSGITNNDGTTDKNILKDPNNPNSPGGDCVNVHSPLMIDNANENWLMQGGHKYSALARANLVDGTHYRVILGFTYSPVYKDDGVSVDRTVPTLHWYLYNLDTNEVVEERSMATWNWFTGSNEKVNYLLGEAMTGSIVLYGKFGTTLTIDKLYGVYEDTTIENVVNALNNSLNFKATFVGLNGEVLKTIANVPTTEKVSYGEEMPAPPRVEDSAFTYAYEWDIPLGYMSKDTTYTLKVVANPKDNVNTYKTIVNGANIKLLSSWIGDGANYTKGQNNGGGVDQSYFAIDGNYGLNTYVAFDFTGKNMPEIAFFAKNYNNTMYAEGTDKQGIVVVTGITSWNGGLNSGVNGNGTKINYGFPYMIQDASNGGFCQGALRDSKLGRANLVDGTRYRVIIGFTGEGQAITLHWYLYNLDTNEVVEQDAMTTWNFFTGADAKVGNMTIEDLVGSIVLYGKFGVDTQIDRFCGIYENSSIDAIVEELGMN